ncbi:MAG: rod shape-determining protein MreC [Chloroflexota bacterium]|nr:rod shape-determining protein MreC [Chloroflexota bacterium]
MTSSRTASWLVTVALIALSGFFLTATGLAGPLRSGAQLVTEPLTAIVSGLTRPLADFVGNVGSYGDIREENRELRLENERLRADLARMREEETRTAEVEELLNLRSQRSTETFVLASVVGRDPNPLRDAIMISRGSGDGVREGMTVLGRGGALVGTVERVQEGMSWVRLITDAKSDVNAVIQESRAQALASGKPDGTVVMQFLAQGVEVKPGDTVLTSGLGGSYPREYLIGTIRKVEGGTLDVFKEAEIEPAVRLSSLEHVAVLTSFQPLKLGGR